VILAGAGLIRLELEAHVTQWLPLEVMLPAPGQGALAVQCRVGDKATLGLLAALESPSTRAAVTAERQFLLGLGGGCAAPAGAYAGLEAADGMIHLRGMAASGDGGRIVRVSGEGVDPVELGSRLAQQALAQGARQWMNRHPEV
jgi:hydroxymethylbilane synthase